MIRRLASPYVAIIIALLLVASQAGAKAPPASHGAKHFLWRAESKKATVFILGSIHYMKKNIYPLSPVIEKAFDVSNVLVVEADVNSLTGIDLAKFISVALYPDDETLRQHVSAETYNLLSKKASEVGIPMVLAEKQKPWFLALTLTALELVKMGFDPDYGIDRHFLSEAEGKKRISELESLDYQIGLFSGFSDEEQEVFLVYTLNGMAAMDEETGRMVGAWRTGDAGAVEEMLSKSLSGGKLTSVYEKLLYQRNRNMAEKIEGFLGTHETYFVVVGAGHLVGGKGIIEILRRKGFRIEQL